MLSRPPKNGRKPPKIGQNTANRSTYLNQKFRVVPIVVTFLNYIPNFKSLAYTVPEILLNYTENRQKAAKYRQALHRSTLLSFL
jgi:hypothetical protein